MHAVAGTKKHNNMFNLHDVLLDTVINEITNGNYCRVFVLQIANLLIPKYPQHEPPVNMYYIWDIDTTLFLQCDTNIIIKL